MLSKPINRRSASAAVIPSQAASKLALRHLANVIVFKRIHVARVAMFCYLAAQFARPDYQKT